MQSVKKWIGVVGLILSSSGANALGVGDLHVLSGLNQPFQAEIPLLDVAKDTALEQVKASLAANEVFEARNITKSDLLFDFKLVAAYNDAGQPVIKVTSTRTVSEPALVLLVEVKWPEGTIVREYTVFLSPSASADQ